MFSQLLADRRKDKHVNATDKADRRRETTDWITFRKSFLFNFMQNNDILLVIRVCQKNSSEYVMSGSVGGDCVVPLRRSTFSQSAWSVRGAREWNSLPDEIINL